MPAEQLCFPFEPAPPSPVLHRLFFAILAPPDAALPITRFAHRLRGDYGLKSRPIASSRLHISLRGFGDYPALPDMLVDRARSAGASVSAPAFETTLDRVTSFGRGDGKRPVVLRARKDPAELAALHVHLGEAMKKAGLGRWVAPHFAPHMTLLYDKREVKERAIEPIRMTVRDFVLVQSLVGQSRYIELGRWALRY
jgi:2'-5' RNA ligase